MIEQMAIESNGWQWCAGMLASDGRRVNNFDLAELSTGRQALVPDFDDPGTLGCLVALVRDSWNDPKLHVYWSIGLARWTVMGVALGRIIAEGQTEAEALVAALRAAP